MREEWDHYCKDCLCLDPNYVTSTEEMATTDTSTATCDTCDLEQFADHLCSQIPQCDGAIACVDSMVADVGCGWASDNGHEQCITAAIAMCSESEEDEDS